MHLLTKEAVRKICRLFLEVSAALQNENEKLKIKVEQMDIDLKAMVEKGEGREEPKRPTHILHNGKIFQIKPVDLSMMPVNNVKTNTVVSALLSMGDVSQVNTVIVQEETTARNTGSSTDPVKERSQVKSGTKTSVIKGAAEAYSKPIDLFSSSLCGRLDCGLNTKPSFRDTESKGEPMRAVVPEETDSGRGGHEKETSSRTGTGSIEYSHGIQQSIFTEYSHGIQQSISTEYSHGIQQGISTEYSHRIQQSISTEYSHRIQQSIFTEYSRAFSQKTATEYSSAFSQNTATEYSRAFPQKTATEYSRAFPQNTATEYSRAFPQNTATEYSRAFSQNTATEYSRAFSQNTATEYSRAFPSRGNPSSVTYVRRPSTRTVC
ncbi:uncharacterized protein LOC112253710 [Oncorhynchus tshawytscha]|uniref:uncharacterized protein LOC112253710 n=1 Tax=Oncorhynchus tshawytscha TaxID=74940 RepID=UPI001C3CF546|nr:uncharacterized protein LOC112253710 [Oncorhynchus tshawytscha]